jgi:DNA-binding GntR family transcriptional regulator
VTPTGALIVPTDSSLYEQLREAILNGEFRSSEALVETTVAERFGVSRTPVREALQRLEQDGIVQRIGRQFRVRVTTPEEVLEIYDCRVVLEAVAAEWAARNRTDVDLTLLERALTSMAEPADRTPAEMARVNRAFHDRLWKASHNETLCDLLDRLEVQTRRYPEPTISQPGRWDKAVQEHGELLQAIRDRDVERAGQLSAAHMRAARDLRLDMIQLDDGL